MRNKYLLLGAASALMLAACSEDIKGPDSVRPAEDGLNLTSLSPASQAGRVSLPGETRGQKADRLQLVAKIAPIAGSDAAAHHWSATGIAISGKTAYVSWHSDYQAEKISANAWGGALDAISIDALVNGQGDVIKSTQTSSRVKFNNVVAGGTNLYFPLTCYNNGAVIGRLAPGAEVMDTIGIPGSSANAIEVVGTTLYAVTGYAGGAYSMPVSFTKDSEFVEIAPMANNFGGKYIVGGKILRTDDTKAYILNVESGAETELDVPLTSSLKYAEAYDPAKGEWYPLEGDKAAYYGKHTMAIDGNYTYVGAGKNGLRIYAATGLVWNNNTNTTAVCVATVDGEKYIFAATGAGLRVYEPYNSEKDSLPLYAFEVKNYDLNGMAADAPNSNAPEAGTTAHSSNFVAVDSESGLIFVACGQSGVYVFRLNQAVESEKKLTGFITSNGGGSEEVDPDSEPVTLTVPDGPEVDDMTFENWVDKDGNVYNPGDSKDFNPGETIELTAVYSAVVTFKDGDTQTIVKVKVGEKVAATKFPNANTPEDKVFAGWVIEGTSTPFTSSTVVEKNVTVVPDYKDKEYILIVTFDGNKPSDAKTDPAPIPGVVKSGSNSITIPAETPAIDDKTFLGWWTNKDENPLSFILGQKTAYQAGDTFTSEAANVTLYAIWADHVTGGGEQGEGGDEPDPVQPEDPNPEGPGSGEGGDVPPGQW